MSIVSAAILLIAMVIQRASGLIAPILLALVVTIAVSPLVARWERRGLSQNLAIAAIFVLTALVIALCALAVVDSVGEITHKLGDYRQLLERIGCSGRLVCCSPSPCPPW